MGMPEPTDTDRNVMELCRYQHSEFSAKVLLQPNGPSSWQRVMVVYPLDISKPRPAVAVPFYYPEAMLGFDPANGQILPRFKGIEMMLHLVRRGYVVASAEAYHLTIHDSPKDRNDFSRWPDAAAALQSAHPNWTGIGKLVYDTKLLLDILQQDPMVDSTRIGIAGHSLGGKMAFYTGCLDRRVKVILASDFGIGWDQTNWRDPWYWGDRVDDLICKGMDHSQLLSIAYPKAFCLLAGEADNEQSLALIQKAKGYRLCDERICFINHASGHRPPWDALQQGYDFLERWL